MTDPAPAHDERPQEVVEPIHPVGAWVIGGFVIFAAAAIWILVSLLFYVRS